MTVPYPAPVEAQMQRYYPSLSEKDRRRYAAIEAVKLEYGGQAYVRRLLGCHHDTLALGLAELNDTPPWNRSGFANRAGGATIRIGHPSWPRRGLVAGAGAPYGGVSDG